MTFLLWIKPWWTRWLATSTVSVPAAVLWPWTVPSLIDSWSWRWGPAIAVACGLVLAAGITGAQASYVRPYREAVAGLATSAERSRAVRAVRFGGVPSEPAVLAAALRFGEVWEAAERRRQRSFWVRKPWVYPVVISACVALEFVVGNARLGVGLLVLDVYSAAAAVGNQRTAARVSANLVALRDAARAIRASS